MDSRNPTGNIDFKAIFSESFSGLPPEEIIKDVNPWKRAMSRVLAGMALCTITLNFFWLNYLLPAIGMVLCLLGLRALRRENRWFTACFVLVLLRCVYFFPDMIRNTFIFREDMLPAGIEAALTNVALAVQLAELFCLWRGLRALQRKAGLPPRAGSVLALMLWYGAVYALALLQGDAQDVGLLLPLTMVVFYILILGSIYKTAKGLTEAGYAIRPAPVRVSDGCLALLLAGVLVLGCAAGYLFGGRYPMDWQPAEPAGQEETAELKSQLLALGFPDYVLEDLTAEDLAACAGATRVDVRTSLHRPDSRRAMNRQPDRTPALRLTGIAVQVSGEAARWVVIHHFLWVEDPGFSGTDSVQLWPAYQLPSAGWSADGPVTGRVLCDRNGQTYTAPYYFLGEKTYPDRSFSRDQERTDVFAGFSLPRWAENGRGYLAYAAGAPGEDYLLNSWLSYTHQYTWLQYPVSTALTERMAAPGSNFLGPFTTVQDALQFVPG